MTFNVTFNCDDEISDKILIYIAQTNNSDNLVFDSIIDNKPTYKINYGVYKILYNKHTITIKYLQTDNSNNNDTIIISSNIQNDSSKEVISDFILFVSKCNFNNTNKNYCFINEGIYWKKITEIVNRPINSIFLPNKKDILDNINQFILSKSDYEKFGIKFKKNYLLHGPPGTGKTSMVNCISSEINYDIYWINLSKNLNTTHIIKLISKIPSKSILLLEDIDIISTNQNNGEDFNCSVLLNLLDGILSKRDIITIMTTNYIEKLNKILIRPGRIDNIYSFNYCIKSQIIEMYNHYYKHEKIDSNILKLVIDRLDNESMSMAALQKFIFTNKETQTKLKKNIKMLDDLIIQYNTTYHNIYN